MTRISAHLPRLAGGWRRCFQSGAGTSNVEIQTVLQSEQSDILDDGPDGIGEIAGWVDIQIRSKNRSPEPDHEKDYGPTDEEDYGAYRDLKAYSKGSQKLTTSWVPELDDESHGHGDVDDEFLEGCNDGVVSRLYAMTCR